MKSRFTLALIFGFALKLAAQDVTVTGLSWVDPNDTPDTLPVAKIAAPDYPERLHGLTEIGYTVNDVSVDAEGKKLSLMRVASDPFFEEAVSSTMGDWHFKPARRDNKPVNSLVRFAFIFNPACADKNKTDATPRLMNVILPELPAKLVKKDAPTPKFYVTASVDAKGQVTKAAADAGSPEELGQLAEEAVLKWTFVPARKDGQPVMQDVRVPVLFLEPSDLNLQADIPPEPVFQASPVYPFELRKLGLRGEVKVGFITDVEGHVRNPAVLSSTNPALNQPAIDAILKWRFKPGKKNGVPVNVRMMVPITFLLEATPNGGREPYRVDDYVNQDKLPPELRFDIPPKPANAVFAVYPFELLRDHVEGSAKIKFLVSPDGLAVQATVTEATRPEFGLALIAMIDEWKYQPAMKDGKPTWSAMALEQTFVRTTVSEMASSTPADWPVAKSDVPVSESAMDLLRELKKEKPDICPIKELDARPQLLSRHPPVFPFALIGKVTTGEAVIEFLIDRDGNVQLPRIISATDPAFGYAAVQGVAGWKFSSPTSHGKPVVVRAQIPVKFTAPAPKPAPDAAAPPAQN